MGALAVGIDLGTTNSCVGVYRNNKVEIIQNEENSYVIPSWVSFTDNGILTGHEAKDEAHKYIRNTVFEFKRLMGQRFTDEKVQNVIKSLPYEVIDDNGFLKIQVNYQGRKQEYFPEEISSYILQKLRDLAESYLGQNITKVVVTVPAYFNEHQRKATIDAATIAGFKEENVRIINEPTAAALAFSYQHVKRYSRNVLVYDFGGGTFDVSIVNVGEGKCMVKATKGDLHLGGTDIDFNLVNFIKEDFKRQYEEQILDNEATMRRLKNSCEQIKKKLSGRLIADIELNNLSGKDYMSSLSRQKFEEINKEIFERTLSIVEDCLERSGLSKEEIDEIVLVGGSSRIPRVQELLKEYFGEDKINKGVNPDEAVAYGAAIHATCLVGNKSVVEDVNSLSLGIAEMGFLSSVIIPCNTSIPTKATETYCTVSDDQGSAKIIVFQGEALFVEDNFKLGEFTLSGLRHAPAGSVKINICFEFNADGILNVTASETDAQNEGSITIDVKRAGLTPDQIRKRIEEMEDHRINDLKRREFLRAKYHLEKLCQKVVTDSDTISDVDARATLREKCDEICEWLKGISINERNEIDQKKQELESMCNSNSINIEDEAEDSLRFSSGGF